MSGPLGWIDGLVARPVIVRETARTSRQWRTYAGRVLFSGVLLGVLIAASAATATASRASWIGSGDTADLAWVGRALFVGFAVCEVIVAAVAAPLVVAAAVIEEREEQTLDLLVMTRLSPVGILGAKLVSRLLLLLMMVLGALPVLSVVTSFGGVSVAEVLAVTSNALITVVVLGLLGGVFGLLSRSPALCAAAALAWAIPTFVMMPALYALAVGSMTAFGEVSPLYGTSASGPAALLPMLFYLPTLAGVMGIAGRLFVARVAGGGYLAVFSSQTWAVRFWLTVSVVLGVTLAVGAPILVPVAWYTSAHLWPNPGAFAHLAARGTIWLFFSASSAAFSVIYARVTAEWIVALETLISPRVGGDKRGRAQSPKIGDNPVLWRETRVGSWVSAGLIVATWLVVMYAMFQSFVWLIPGALLLIGGANAIVGCAAAAWWAVASLEDERRAGTLDLLLITRLPPWRLLAGKAIAVMFPSAPLVLVGALLVTFGLPYFQSVWSEAWDWLDLLHGATVGLWLVAFWLFAIAAGLTLGAYRRGVQSGTSIVMGGIIAWFALPWMVGTALSGFWPARLFSRLFVPIAGVDAPWWEPLPVAVLLLGAAAGLFVLSASRLRVWNALGAGT